MRPSSSLGREIGDSILLLMLTAFISGTALGVGLLAIWSLG